MKRFFYRQAFTLLELLVVIAVIAVLAGMVLAASGIMRKSQKHLATTTMMGQIVVAMNNYLEKWPRLGDASANDFRQAPWQYLVVRPKRSGLDAFLEWPTARLAELNAGVISPAKSEKSATHLFDHFGTTSDNIISFTIIERGAGSARYARAIEMRSSAGTPTKRSDDIIYRFVSSLDVTDAALSAAVAAKQTSYSPLDAGKFVLVKPISPDDAAMMSSEGDWQDPLSPNADAHLEDHFLDVQLRL